MAPLFRHYAIFACPALTAERSLAAYTPTYAYEFNDVNAPERYLPPVGFPYGAAHESEVQYLFALSNTANPGHLSASQQRLARAMKQDWTNFARTGAPGAGWPQFAAASHQTLSSSRPGPLPAARRRWRRVRLAVRADDHHRHRARSIARSGDIGLLRHLVRWRRGAHGIGGLLTSAFSPFVAATAPAGLTQKPEPDLTAVVPTQK